MVAKMPTIATAIMSSIRVNPRDDLRVFIKQLQEVLIAVVVGDVLYNPHFNFGAHHSAGDRNRDRVADPYIRQFRASRFVRRNLVSHAVNLDRLAGQPGPLAGNTALEGHGTGGRARAKHGGKT